MSASVATVMTLGMVIGRGRRRDQSATVFLPRAILVVGHARDRGKLGRIIDPASGIALARHAGAAITGIRPLAVAAPRPIGMVLAHPARVVANQARHGL
jgi:hypothetical protein